MSHVEDILTIIEPDLRKMMSWEIEDAENNVDLIPHFLSCLDHALVLRSEHQELPVELLKNEDAKAAYVISVEIQILSLFIEKFCAAHYEKLNFKGIAIFYKLLSKAAESRGWPQHVFNKTILLACGLPELMVTQDIKDLSCVRGEGVYYN